MATKQGFYSRVHLYDDLTISVFHFHFLFPVSTSTVSNCPHYCVNCSCHLEEQPKQKWRKAQMKEWLDKKHKAVCISVTVSVCDCMMIHRYSISRKFTEERSVGDHQTSEDSSKICYR